MSIESPQRLYALHQDRICNILSQYNGPVDAVMLEEWIIQVSRSLCISRDSSFQAELQKILRREARDVLHGQIIDSRNPTQNVGSTSTSSWGCSSNLRLSPRINPRQAPPKPSVSQSVGSSPPIYVSRVSVPGGDRFASLPPFPDPESNIVFAPGTFDDFTPEEIIDHYRPAITRMVFEAMGY